MTTGKTLHYTQSQYHPLEKLESLFKDGIHEIKQCFKNLIILLHNYPTMRKHKEVKLIQNIFLIKGLDIFTKIIPKKKVLSNNKKVFLRKRAVQ